MDSYPLGGHHADEVASRIRKVLGKTGKKPTMPLDDKGAVKGEELALVIAWADAFDRANPPQPKKKHHHHSGSHDHHDHHNH